MVAPANTCKTITQGRHQKFPVRSGKRWRSILRQKDVPIVDSSVAIHKPAEVRPLGRALTTARALALQRNVSPRVGQVCHSPSCSGELGIRPESDPASPRIPVKEPSADTFKEEILLDTVRGP